MSDLSKKTLNPSGDTKNYIENYWTKKGQRFCRTAPSGAAQ